MASNCHPQLLIRPCWIWDSYYKLKLKLISSFYSKLAWFIKGNKIFIKFCYQDNLNSVIIKLDPSLFIKLSVFVHEAVLSVYFSDFLKVLTGALQSRDWVKHWRFVVSGWFSVFTRRGCRCWNTKVVKLYGGNAHRGSIMRFNPELHFTTPFCNIQNYKLRYKQYVKLR